MEQLHNNTGAAVAAPVATRPWGQIDGKDVLLYTLTNRRGSEITLTNFGASIVSLSVADRQGRLEDVVLGYDTAEEYRRDPFYMGCVVGRYANRIAGGRVRIGETDYQLATREGGYHLHGGNKGFNKQVFEGHLFRRDGATGICLHLLSPHLDEGFPGQLSFTVTYVLHDDDDRLEVRYEALSDRATIVNFTQHTYFNLSGNPATTILDHRLQLHSPFYLPVNTRQVPLGQVAEVAGTAFDFREAHTIGERIDADDVQLKLSGGYDHSYVLKKTDSAELRHAATVWEEKSGRVMDVFTTEPAVHFYSGNFLGTDTRGKGGGLFGARSGLCLETQHYPDAPNHPHFPSTLLLAGSRYSSSTVFVFSVK